MTSRRIASSGRASLGVYDRVDPIELEVIQEEPPSDASTMTFGTQSTPNPPSTKGLLVREDEREFPWLPRSSPIRSSELVNYDPKSNAWPLGIKSGLFLVAAILILNATITMWASLSFQVRGGIGTLHVGPCEQIRRMGLGLHIVINCIGTLLLGASNFCMQCLTSPTRNEVDRQHLNKKWLEVGILSLRNLRCINRRRVCLWFFLGLSSVPIHLMFNSAVFVNLTANRYVLAAVASDFESGAPWDMPLATQNLVNLVTAMQANTSSYERLNVVDCIKNYGVDFLYNRRHVLAVTQDEELDNSVIGTLSWSYDLVRNSWICGTNVTDEMILTPLDIDEYDCTVEEALSSLPLWVGEQFLQVDHCLSQRVPDRCRLQFSLPIMFIVIFCNIVKLGCILLTLLRRETTLITMGDTIASFLLREDETTKGMCTVTRKEIIQGYWPDYPEPRRWIYSRHFRWEAVGWWRWVTGNTFCFLACVGFGVLLWKGIDTTTTNPDMATWWNLGFGEVTSSSIIRWQHPMLGDSGLIKNVLLANLPQVILSAMYMVYNQIYTCMAFADEYASYFNKRQPLRVTQPKGLQKSTRFLTLPYRYMIPLMAASAGTHFVLSQAFFLVAVDVFDDNGDLDRDKTILTVGFSIIAFVILVIVVCIGAILTFALGYRRFKSGMPLAGPCSAAISAACHLAEFERAEEAAERPVQWGVVGSENGVGHLAFSSGVVSEPVPGRLYI